MSPIRRKYPLYQYLEDGARSALPSVIQPQLTKVPTFVFCHLRFCCHSFLLALSNPGHRVGPPAHTLYAMSRAFYREKGSALYLWTRVKPCFRETQTPYGGIGYSIYKINTVNISIRD